MTPYLVYFSVFTAMSNQSVCSAADLASNAIVTLSMPFSSFFCSNQVLLLSLGHTRVHTHTYTRPAPPPARALAHKYTQEVRLANLWASCILISMTSTHKSLGLPIFGLYLYL